MTKKIKSQKLHQQEISQNQESSSNSPSHHQPDPDLPSNPKIPQSQPDNLLLLIPFPKFQKSFPIFNKNSRSNQFKSYAKFKSDSSFAHFKQAFSHLSGLPFQDLTHQPNQCNKPPLMHQQNVFVCVLPQKTTFFIHIYDAGNSKCNIQVMNASGYVYAYFVEIRYCRKYCKIYKMIKKINSSSFMKNAEYLFVIYDEVGCGQNQLNSVIKIADYASQFCYYLYTHHQFQIPSKLTLRKDKKSSSNQSQDPKAFFHQDGNLFCSHSKIFLSSPTPIENINSLIQLQKQIENLTEFVFDSSQSSVDFILKNIFINYSKSFNFKDKTEMYTSFQKIILNYQQRQQNKKQNTFGNPDDHYAELMEFCKECVHCSHNKNRLKKHLIDKKHKEIETQFIYDHEDVKIVDKNTKSKLSEETFTKKIKKPQQHVVHSKQSDDEESEVNVKIRKSKYRCEGCSATAKKDVPLCMQCFQSYHQKKEKLWEKSEKKLVKKALEKKIQEKKEQNQMMELEASRHGAEKEKSSTSDGLMSSDLLQKMEEEEEVSACDDPALDFSLEELLIAEDFVKMDELKKQMGEINAQTDNFIKNFMKFYSDRTTKNIALNIIQFVQIELASLTNDAAIAKH